MNILIGADLVPTNTNLDLFARGDGQALVGDDLQQILQSADYRIFNLEVPLTDRETPLPKCGPNLIAPTKCVAGYQALGADLLTLANNHILDQDQQGLKSTLHVLERADIAYTGVGSTPEEAAKPYIFECDGKRIGVYACAEHEFSIVTDTRAGANPIDLLESPEHVAMLKEQCDFVIVLYHGGKEHYRYPSPHLQKVCRKLVDKGADLVLCQHSHCIGCEEKYQSGTIVYGQGNFLFDRSESEFWQTSLLVQINDGFEITYIPLIKANNKVRLADDTEAEGILSGFLKRGNEIKVPGFIQANYEQFAMSFADTYLTALCGIRGKLLFRVVNKLIRYRFLKWFTKHWYGTRERYEILNYTQCEAHRELLISAILTDRRS